MDAAVAGPVFLGRAGGAAGFFMFSLSLLTKFQINFAIFESGVIPGFGGVGDCTKEVKIIHNYFQKKTRPQNRSSFFN
jgi:hypothetical protein